MKKGFTLVELLGVITILGVLSLIVFPIVLKQINGARGNISNATKLLIVDAAKDYIDKNSDDFKKVNGISYCIGMDDLDLIDLKDENFNDIDKSKKVRVNYNNGFNYDVVDSCSYSLSRNGISVPIVSDDSGLYLSTTDDGRLIYRGGTPNNYIYLKEMVGGVSTNVLYRIISFESDGTIKVVRNESIGDIPFDSKEPRKNTNVEYYCNSDWGCNVWGNQLNTYYKGRTLVDLQQDFYFYYYQNNSATNFSIKPNNNFGIVTTDSTLNIYLNSTFYDTLDFKEKIDNHEFNVGGIYYYSYYDGYNGGDKGLLKEKREEQLYKWNGKIALMNITEFVEASLSDTCTSVYSNYFYQPNNSAPNPNNASSYIRYHENGNWPCSLNNWNYNSTISYQWTLTSNPFYIHAMWLINSAGYYNGLNSAVDSRAVRPAFFLKSNVLLEGDGSYDNPYMIKS